MTETDSLRSSDAAEGTGTNAERPPRLRGIPLLGTTLSIARDPFGFLRSARARGDVVAYEAYGTEFALVFEPAAVETVLVSRADEFRKGEFETDFGELIAPDGILFTEGKRWRRQRQLLQSSFTPDRIRSYADAMVDEAAALVDDWDEGETVALRDAMSTYALRVLTRTLFDLPLESDRAAVVTRAADAVNDYASPGRLALGSILPSWFPDRVEREYEAAMADLESLVDDLVAQRRASEAAGDDLLSLLARAEYPDGSRLPPEAVRDQLITFLFAGHETTATSLAFTCWLLAGDSAVRAELDRELEAVCGGREPTVEDLDRLAYTEAVVREALRLYPPATGVYREPKSDVVLSGYRVPAGTTLQLSIYGIQRDGRWWTDPGTFRPERWLADDEGDDGRCRRLESDPDRPEYAYFPFSGGPRHCLGMRFAMTELQLALATIAGRVEFDRVADSLEPSLGVTLDPGPTEVRVRNRREKGGR
ncbi:cytochrome P450 [Halopiger djelfimassiliensis]|uniref:cytochrome P450 n=1 Tax=Halopiger djelfimassiliensis TaxID=1293047 RepID=UPI000677691A|nr:cytochrome P450 [Halopiger djelfimassiliensis]